MGLQHVSVEGWVRALDKCLPRAHRQARPSAKDASEGFQPRGRSKTTRGAIPGRTSAPRNETGERTDTRSAVGQRGAGWAWPGTGMLKAPHGEMGGQHARHGVSQRTA